MLYCSRTVLAVVLGYILCVFKCGAKLGLAKCSSMYPELLTKFWSEIPSAIHGTIMSGLCIMTTCGLAPNWITLETYFKQLVYYNHVTAYTYVV